MQLANTEFYWLLAAMPIFAVVLWHQHSLKLRRLKAFFGQRQFHYGILTALSAAVAILLITSSLRPQWGFTWKENKQKGVDIMVALDVSESMLAQDLKPSRLERARREIFDLIDRLRGDRIGLVAFAGVAFVESPLTSDYGTIELFLRAIKPEYIPVAGTNIEAALRKCIEAFERSETTRDRAVILVTDGEDFSGNWELIKKKAEEADTKIFVIGVGTPEGAPIPVGGRLKKNREGRTVVSKLMQPQLENLAQATGGIYVTSLTSDADSLTLYDQGILNLLKRQETEVRQSKRWNEYYQLPLAFALLALIVSRYLVHNPLLILFILLLPRVSFASEEAALAFEKGDFAKAKSLFEKQLKRDPENPKLQQALAATEYRSGNFEAARDIYKETYESTEDERLRAELLYNAGNSMAQLGEYQEALAAYKESLKLDQGDREVEENLEYVKKLIEEQQGGESDQEKDSEQNETSEQEEDSQQEEQKDQKNEDNQEGKDQQNGEQEHEQPQEEQQEEEAQPGDSPSEEQKAEQAAQTLLDSVEEGRNSFYKFRVRQAMEMMRRENIVPPEQDW